MSSVVEALRGASVPKDAHAPTIVPWTPNPLSPSLFNIYGLLFRMPWLSSCCCGFSIRSGTKAVAILSLVSYMPYMNCWLNVGNSQGLC